MSNLPVFEHTVGSHSDDRGGDADKRCKCQDEKPLTMSVTFTIKELEKMLSNAKAGGSVEVLLTLHKELILR